MSKVYIVQQSPKLNYAPAEKWGELIPVFPIGAQLYGDPQYFIDLARNRMCEATQTDYLLLAGDPCLIAIAAAVFYEKTDGFMPLLKWDKHVGEQGNYHTIVCDMQAPPFI